LPLALGLIHRLACQPLALRPFSGLPFLPLALGPLPLLPLALQALGLEALQLGLDAGLLGGPHRLGPLHDLNDARVLRLLELGSLQLDERAAPVACLEQLIDLADDRLAPPRQIDLGPQLAGRRV